jgi:hypothetical protein
MTQDISAIQNLLSSYCHKVDRGTAREVAELFMEDGILRPYYDGKYECKGRVEVERWYAFYHEKMSSKVRNLKHIISSSEISVSGRSGSAVTYLTAYFVGIEDGVAYQVLGTYFDEVTKNADEWLFKDRRIEVEYMTPLNSMIEGMEPLGFEPN